MTARAKTATGHWARVLRRLRQRPHFSVGVVTFGVLCGLLALGGTSGLRLVLLAFDGAAIVFLAGLARLFSTTTPEVLRDRAREQYGERYVFLYGNVALSIAIVVALGLEWHATRNGGLDAVLLPAASLLLAWFFLNSIFALHYAHDYHASDDDARPLEFPGDQMPDYWDFTYFAIVIGMTFQVSDVQICERRLRRVALAHSVVAFLFNVLILALTVNLVAGKV